MASPLLLDVDFSVRGNSSDYLLDGWGVQEPKHRWTLGQQSRLVLRLPGGSAGTVLAICATPCLHPPKLVAQTVMLALDDRLLATVRFHELQVAAFRLPQDLRAETVLSIVHLHCEAPRAPSQARGGLSLGLQVQSIRVFAPGFSAPLVRDVAATDDRSLALQFESIGQGCQFGLIQRACGAEPLGLLRFVDTMTALLYEGLARGFAGIDAPGRLDMQTTEQSRPTYRWHHLDFGFFFDTRAFVDETDPDALAVRQSARLGLLRRKFLEDCQSAEKIFVLTRGDCLTEPEALAVFCALCLHGDCTLLWTVFGDPARAGEVDILAPRFMRGQLGSIDHERYAALPEWRSTLQRALTRHRERIN